MSYYQSYHSKDENASPNGRKYHAKIIKVPPVYSNPI